MEARHGPVGVRVARPCPRQASLPIVASALILIASACGGGASKPTPTTAPSVLTVHNETPCIIHVRFDNGPDAGRVAPGTTNEFGDPRLADYSYVNIESTMAIFHTYDLRTIRQDGYVLTVRPAMDDHPCVEQPPG